MDVAELVWVGFLQSCKVLAWCAYVEGVDAASLVCEAYFCKTKSESLVGNSDWGG